MTIVTMVMHKTHLSSHTNQSAMEKEMGVQIVGMHNRMQVALLLDFPEPVISPCTIVTANVTDQSGQTAPCDILLAEDRAYKMESRILKESIYGSVRQGHILNKMGDGTYSYDGNSAIAVKIFSKETIDIRSSKCQEDHHKEFATMQYLGGDHPNIMGQIDCLEDTLYFYSIMPFCEGGELFDHVDSGGMPEKKARKIFMQLLDGMEYMQRMGVAHRDISLENILIANPDILDLLTVTLIDWGMAVRLPMHRTRDGYSAYLSPPTTPCGKKHYMAPEVLANGRARTAEPLDWSKADVWAVGVVLFILLTELPPFDEASVVCKRFVSMTAGHLALILKNSKINLSDDVVSLMQSIFQRDPVLRPSVVELRSHPWVVNATDAPSY